MPRKSILILGRLCLVFLEASLLSGCGASSPYTLRREPTTSSITLADQRPQEESRTMDVTRFTAYVGDELFVPNKMRWLAWRLEQEFPNFAGKEIKVKHFYFLKVTSQSGSVVAGAPLAGISYAGALLVNTAFSSSGEIGEVLIELDIDGATYRADKAIPLVERDGTLSAGLGAIEATFDELANAIRTGLSIR